MKTNMNFTETKFKMNSTTNLIIIPMKEKKD